jgi:uncharacterized protein YkwD
MDQIQSHLSALRSHSSATSTSHACHTIVHALKNILDHPETDKFRQIKLDNPAFHQKVGRHPAAVQLLEDAGFSQLSNVPTQSSILLYSDGIDPARTRLVLETVEGFAAQLEHTPAPSPAPSKASISNRGKKRKAPQHTETPRERRERIAAIHEARLRSVESKAAAEPMPVAPQPSQPGLSRVPGTAEYYRHMSELKQQISKIRQERHRNYRNTKQGTRNRIFTLSDIQEMAKADRERAAAGMPGSHALGKEMLKLTNEFRAKQGLPALRWHQGLCDIGMVHSKDMASGKVPFSHQGVEERFRQYPFPSRQSAENLAMSKGVGELSVARVAVEGWIDSPGHRKNLLGNFNWCGIAVFQGADGGYYSTQLFGAD